MWLHTGGMEIGGLPSGSHSSPDASAGRRVTFTATRAGDLAGIPATGRQVPAPRHDDLHDPRRAPGRGGQPRGHLRLDGPTRGHPEAGGCRLTRQRAWVLRVVGAHHRVPPRSDPAGAGVPRVHRHRCRRPDRVADRAGHAVRTRPGRRPGEAAGALSGRTDRAAHGEPDRSDRALGPAPGRGTALHTDPHPPTGLCRRPADRTGRRR